MPMPPAAARAVGYAAAAWCLGFAGMSAWQVAGDLTGPTGHQRYAAYATGLAIMGVLVGLLKLAGAAVALAAVGVEPGAVAPAAGAAGGGVVGRPSACLACTRPATC